MLSLLYDIFLFLFAVPSLLCRRKLTKARLGLSLPHFKPKKGQKVIWIHAVSMGETRAIISLYRKLREIHPGSAIVISTTTETGQMEAKRTFPDADAHFLLPLDFSWGIRLLLDRIQPDTLILCESDFWYHLLKLAKERGARIYLVNGKVSQRSCHRFRAFPSFTRRLFKNFDTLCVQSETYRDRFLSMGIPAQKLVVTGNLKLDTPVKKIDTDAMRASLGIARTDRVLVIGSTHAPEEEHILAILPAVWEKIPNLKVLIVPRHPERFDEVARLIQMPFRRYSERKAGEENLILIDAMGQLNACYQIADLAIVGGSFAPIGGHNIFEPIAYGVPVLFGPHMHSQLELLEIVLKTGAGMQVTFDQLPSALIRLLENDDQYVQACKSLAQSVQGATDRTLVFIS